MSDEHRRVPLSEAFTVQDVYDDLCTIADVAKMTGQSISAVKRWLERRAEIGCPSPVRRLGNCDVYSLEEWKGWWAMWRVTRHQPHPKLSRQVDTDE